MESTKKVSNEGMIHRVWESVKSVGDLGGRSVVQRGSPQTFYFVLAILGIAGFGLTSAGIIGYAGAMSTLTQVTSLFFLSVGSSLGLASLLLFAVFGCRKNPSPVSQNASTVPTKAATSEGVAKELQPATEEKPGEVKEAISVKEIQVVLEKEGRKIITTVTELYKIAEEHCSSSDKNAYLMEVKAQLESQDFIENAKQYISKRSLIEENTSTVEGDVLSFFKSLLGDASYLPWNTVQEEKEPS